MEFVTIKSHDINLCSYNRQSNIYVFVTWLSTLILLFKIMSNMLKLGVVTFLISLSYKKQEHANVTIHRG